MMNELKLADLGEGMHEAEIVEWLVKEGDTVRLDQPIVRVETDKAIVEIPSPVAGRIREMRFQPGQTAKVGEVLVVYDAPVIRNGAGKTQHTQQVNPSVNGAPALAPAANIAGAAPENKKRVLAAPAVRKLAFELGIDLAEVMPTAANGRISMEDVRAYAERAKAAPAEETPVNGAPALAPGARPPAAISPTAPAADERQPLTGLRKRIAEHMERSWRTVPHATAFDEVDGLALKALRESIKPFAEKRGIRLTYIPLLIKLLIPLLKEFPIFNASLDEQSREIIYKRSYHIGIATATP